MIEVGKEIGKAALDPNAQTDRYLFVLLLALVFTAIFWAGKYLIGQIKQMEVSRADEAAKKTELLTGLFNKLNDLTVMAVKEIAAAATINRDCSMVMSDCRDTIHESTAFIRKERAGSENSERLKASALLKAADLVRKGENEKAAALLEAAIVFQGREGREGREA